MMNEILHIFPEYMRYLFEKCAMNYKHIQEIRLRADQPIILLLNQQEAYLNMEGIITDKKENAITITSEKMLDILNHICNYSIYAYEDEIKQGFITVPGGHRIGLAGQVVLGEKGDIRSLKYINYMNIRIAHEVRGAANPVMKYLYQGGEFLNTLILSPPGCGKTTLLRDVIRQVSDGNSFSRGRSVGVIDERSEIAGSYQGTPQNHIGIRSDVMDSCPKVLGMMMLIRSMAPEVLAVDELGNQEEINMVRLAKSCGCNVIATIHGESMSEILKKDFVKEAFTQHLFQRFIVLTRKEGKCIVKEIYDERLELC